MRVTYDREANAAYVYLVDRVTDGESESQVHSIPTPKGEGEIILDFDAAGLLLGIEVLDADKVLKAELLESADPP